MRPLEQLVDLGNVSFFLLAALTVGSAVLVAFSRNIIHSTVALLGTFTGVAGLYITLSADFLAAVQLLVYVGGTLTLILFAVMLTSKIEDVGTSNAAVGRAVAIPLLLLVLGGLGLVMSRTHWAEVDWGPVPSTARLGHAFLSDYVLPFELASLVLLAALIGAVVLARRAVRRPGELETREDVS